VTVTFDHAVRDCTRHAACCSADQAKIVERWVLHRASWSRRLILTVGRVVVGLKKVGSEAQPSGNSFSGLIQPSRLVVSIAIGFKAGAFAALLARRVRWTLRRGPSGQADRSDGDDVRARRRAAESRDRVDHDSG
jgi:hypothetical protein